MLFEVLDDLVKRRTSAREVVETCLGRLSSLDEDRGVMVASRADAVIEEARGMDRVVPSPSRPLAGVPVVVDAALADDEGVVARARRRGAIVVGRVVATTSRSSVALAHSVQDPDRSSESDPVLRAAARIVASGAVALVLVRDALGSLRVTAADVGLASVHVRPWVLGDTEHVSDGVVAATLPETAWAIDVLREPEGRGRLLAPFTFGGWRPRRVGIWGWVELARSCAPEGSVLEEAVAALEGDGVELIDVDDVFRAPWWSLVEARRTLEAISTAASVGGEVAANSALRAIAALAPLERAIRSARSRVYRAVAGLDAVLAPSTVGASTHGARAGEVTARDDDAVEVGRVHVASLAKLAAASIPVRSGGRSLGVEFLAVSEVRAVATAAYLARSIAPSVLAAPAVPW